MQGVAERKQRSADGSTTAGSTTGRQLPPLQPACTVARSGSIEQDCAAYESVRVAGV